MKMYKYVIGMVTLLVFASDPFQASQRRAPLKVDQKYQYLGYIKGPQTQMGFVRRAGGEIERISMGAHLGLGKVVQLDANRICVRKQGKTWCLMKSMQVKSWIILKS